MSKKKKIVLFSVIGICIILGAVFLFNDLSNPPAVFSPDGLYKITYNRSEKRVTLLKIETDVKAYTVLSDTISSDPVFIWSPNSRYYVQTCKIQDGGVSNLLIDVKNGLGMAYGTDDVKGELEKISDTADIDIDRYVTPVKFLDNQNLLMEFDNTHVSGWYIYDLTNRTAREVHVIN